MQTNELALDIAMKLPDVLWQMDYQTKYIHSRFNDDFATMDEEHYYLRVVLEVPLSYEPTSFVWGIWVEVTKDVHDQYLAAFQESAESLPALTGTIANDIPFYPEAFGQEVSIAFHNETRPNVIVLDKETSLGKDQSQGLTLERHQALDQALFGPLDEGEEDEEDFEENPR